MSIETKNTSGGELVFKQNGDNYVGQYYVQDGKIYAGNPNSGVTGANNGKNPNQQTELIRVSNRNRSDDGFIKAPFGEEQNFPFNLQQDIYETVPEIIDTEVSELKPQSVDNLTPEQILQNRITEMFKEYADLRDQIDGLGAERSHNFLVNSSLPYTEQLDTINELIENIPSYVVNDTGSVDGFVRETTTENLETTFEESDFQPGSVRNTKRNLEIEQLQHERGDDVDSANIDHLANLITQLEAEIEKLKGEADTAEAARASLQQQLEGTLSILSEDEEETLGEIMDDPGKGDVVFEDTFPFPADPDLDDNGQPDIKWLDRWNKNSMGQNFSPPAGGFEGKGAVRIIRKSPFGNDATNIRRVFYLRGQQTYTFTAYVRLGTMQRCRIWIGDEQFPGKPSYIDDGGGSKGPFHHKYGWSAYLDFGTGNLEYNSNNSFGDEGMEFGRYRFEAIDYEIPHSYISANDRTKNFLQPMSGSNRFDGTAAEEDEQYKYTADGDGKWYRLEFDFTPRNNIYQGKTLQGYDANNKFEDDKYVGAPYVRTTIFLYEGYQNHEPGDFVEWSDIKIFQRKDTTFNPQPYDEGDYDINKPFINSGVEDTSIPGRMYRSDRYVSGVINTGDITKYLKWPPTYEWQDAQGRGWSFAPATGVWNLTGLLEQAGAGNEPADVEWNYGVNLINNYDWTFRDGGTPSNVPAYWSDLKGNDEAAMTKKGTTGVYPGTDDSSNYHSENGSYAELGDNDGNLKRAVEHAFPGEEYHVDSYKFNNTLVKIYDANKNKRIGLFQDVLVEGAGGVAYFKLGAYTGGIDHQSDKSIVYLRFFDSDGDIILPDSPDSAVQQGTNTSTTFAGGDGSAKGRQSSLVYGGNSQTIKMYSAHNNKTNYSKYEDIHGDMDDGDDINNSEVGYTGGSPSGWLSGTYYAFSLDYISKDDRQDYPTRDDEVVVWSALSTKVPPNAHKARIYLYTEKTSTTDGDGFVGPVVFKLYDTNPDPSIIDII